jgi:hypothetical protein
MSRINTRMRRTRFLRHGTGGKVVLVEALETIAVTAIPIAALLLQPTTNSAGRQAGSVNTPLIWRLVLALRKHTKPPTLSSRMLWDVGMAPVEAEYQAILSSGGTNDTTLTWGAAGPELLRIRHPWQGTTLLV